MPSARTEVSTERAGRYLVQLCKHLTQISHHGLHDAAPGISGPPQMRHVEWTDDHGVIEFTSGRCTLDVQDQSLIITITADGADDLQRMQQLFATRLETIGGRDNLTVHW